MAADNVVEFSLEAVDKFSKVFGTLGKAIGIAGAVWAATGGAVVAFTKQVTDHMDKINDLSKRYGVTVQAMSQFDHMAKLNGTSVESMAMGIQFLQRNIADAQFGIGESVKAFDSLRFSVKDLEGKTKGASSAMFEIADRIAAIKDPAQQTQLAMEIFGRQGAQLLPILKQGSEGMRRMAEDAKFLGVEMSARATANAAEFQDQMDRVGQALRGASMAAVNEWTPMLTGMANATANFIARSIPAIRNFAQDFMRFMIGAFVVVETVVTTVWNGLKNLFTAKGFDKFIENFTSNAKRAFVWALETAAKFSEILARLLVEGAKIAWTAFYELARWAWMKVFDFITGQDLAGTLGEVLFESIPREAQKYLGEAKLAFGEFHTQTIETLTEVGEAVGGALGLSFDGINTRIDEIISKVQMFGQTVQETTDGQILPTLLKQYEALQAQIQQRQQQIEAEIFFAQTFSEVWGLTLESLNLQLLNWNQVSSQLITQTFQTVSQGIGNAVAQAIVSGDSLGKALQNVLKQVLTNVISMLVQMGVQKLILTALNIKANAASASSELGAGLAKVYVNSFASAAAIPFIGAFIAPGVAATNLAIAGAGAIGAGAAGAGIGASVAMSGVGVAHGGLDFVPDEQTFLLDRGERVLSSRQNEDLTNFLEGGGGGTVIENLSVHVLENATSFDALMQMSPSQVREVTAGKIIEALNSLDRMGIRPVFAERTGR